MKHGAKLLYGNSSACWWMASVFLTVKWASGHPCHEFGVEIHNMDPLLLHLHTWCETHLSSCSTISEQLFIICLSLRTKRRQICDFKCNLPLRSGAAHVTLTCLCEVLLWITFEMYVLLFDMWDIFINYYSVCLNKHFDMCCIKDKNC